MSKQQLKDSLITSVNAPPSEDIHSFFSIFKYADKMDKFFMTVGILSAICAGIASPLFMIFFSTISQIFVPGNQQNASNQGRQLFFKLTFIGIFTWTSHAISMWAWNKSGSRQTLRLKQMYYKTLLQQEVGWFDSNDCAKLTSQISQNTTAIQTAIGEKLSYAVTALVTSMFGFIFSFFKCWQMSLYLSIFLPFMLLGGYLMMKSAALKTLTSKISYQNASAVAQNAFSSIKTVKTLSSQKYQYKKFSQALSSSHKKLKKHILYASLSSSFTNLILMGIYSYGFFIGKTIIIQNSYQNPSDIISTFFCFMVAGNSIGQISPIFKNIADAKIAISKIQKLVLSKRSLIQREDGESIDQINSIKMVNVSFKYAHPIIDCGENDKSIKDEQSILNNINLDLTKGTVTAIVGQSGSGKSTIAQILLKYYNLSHGSILVNNRNIISINSSDYRKKVGYVGQQPVLFSMTIKQNIKLANPNLTDFELVQILKTANAYNFIQTLQNGINTYVGDKGTQLSGGQKQRIAIARALAKNPDLFILDQATSALDQQSERQVQKSIFNLLQKNKIILIIAHRLSTIRKADNIIVLKKGRVCQTGTHQELQKQGNLYYQLIRTQLTHQFQNQKISGQSDRSKQRENWVPQHMAKQEVVQNRKQQRKTKFKSRWQIYLKLGRQANSFKSFLIIGSVFAFISGLVYPSFNFTFANLMGLMKNAQQNSQSINMYCLAFLIIAISSAVSNFIHTFLFALFGEKLVENLRKKLFTKILKFPCAYFDKKQNTPGAISVKLSKDSYQLLNFLTGIVSVLCLNTATIVTSLIFAFSFSWKLTLIVLIFTPLMLAKGAIAVSVIKRISRQSENIEKFLGSFISETINNIKTVKSFGGYDQFLDIFKHKASEMQKITSSKSLKMGILQGFSRSSAILVYAVVFWVASALFSHHQFSQPKDAIISIFCIVFSATVVGQNSQLMPDLAKAQLSASDIIQMVQTKDQFQISKQNQDSSLDKHKIRGSIQFKNVTFKYPSRNQYVLKNFNLKVKQKQKIAIVGYSGSGKSTIMAIIARLYPIQSGQVLVDGYPIQSIGLRKLRRQLGVLLQQPSIFKGSIKQNVLYQYQGKIKYQKQFQKCCQISRVNKFASHQHSGYDKEVGERGNQVSGGQKQRISLARCLIRLPRVFLMDQPTSALDTKTQTQIFQDLQKMIKNRTFIFSAHRLSTVKVAQRILVMKEGVIVQQGTFNGLVSNKNQFYKLLFSGQKGKNQNNQT